MILATIRPSDRFGSLTVLRKAESKRRQATRWRCQCQCKRIRIVKQSKLRGGEVTSCEWCAELSRCKSDSYE